MKNCYACEHNNHEDCRGGKDGCSCYEDGLCSYRIERDQLQAEVEKYKAGDGDCLRDNRRLSKELIDTELQLAEKKAEVIRLSETLGVRLQDAELKIEGWKTYARLLVDELNETMAMAWVHGWRSTRVEVGATMRKKMGLADDWATQGVQK